MEQKIFEAKSAVIVAACGICALSEDDLLQRLEELYWTGYKAGLKYSREEKVMCKKNKLDKKGVDLIVKERDRQVELEGWSSEHDDVHSGGELAKAAACYVLNSQGFSISCCLSTLWPWGYQWWKPNPSNKIKDLTKAGALIAAEIDRLLRLEEKRKAELGFDPVKLFVEKKCQLKEETRIAATELYDHFSIYCLKENISVPSIIFFKKHLLKNFPSITKIKNAGAVHFTGIRLAPPPCDD